MDAAVDYSRNDSGWRAELKLGFRPSGSRTLLAERRRVGPLAVQRPFYPEGGVCHVYLLHPPGGVVGGDGLDIEADLEPFSEVLITTPGATKFYRSGGAVARQSQNLTLDHGASLEWFPQENIFFPGAKVNLITRIDLESDSRIAAWEINCFGRPVVDEPFTDGDLDLRFELRREGRPLLLERFRVTDKTRSYASGLRNHPVSGTLVITGAGERDLDAARGRLAEQQSPNAAVTLIDDVLVARYLGGSTENARRIFTGLWSTLRNGILGREANTPRIWNT